MSTTPASLLEWKSLEIVEPARQAWEQFEPFFEQHGYKLFVPHDDLRAVVLKAPAECSKIRAEDYNSRFLPECLGMERNPSIFYTGIHVAARAPNNVDVVIRIMAIRDEGREHLAIMRALSAPDAQVPENRTVPMIAELQMDDVVFGIFPQMWDSAMVRPWFETIRQLLDALEQVLEGFVFLHQRLIAHRDFAMLEVFSNYGRGWDVKKKRPRCVRTPPIFRSCILDMRYMINDFELSIQFAPDSDPETRLVTGIPIARYGAIAEEYLKPLAPEARLDTPYCPFKADIYQIGASALLEFQDVHILPELLTLFSTMASDEPNARPTAAHALAMLRSIRDSASEDALNGIPVNRLYGFGRTLPGETWQHNG
ncbi:hypothetical protein AURDEDRAFT_159672 [Auricularia subglabra TFB-10046 SS5]|nr:hypothetical protein AURDEDRAFT_159672 [Auricularia subglabra TFB-10046 SS5]